MPYCERCGKKGRRSEIKPYFLKNSSKEVITLCKKCTMKQINEEKEKKSNISNIKCLYCGSPVPDLAETCPFCKQELKDNIIQNTNIDVSEVKYDYFQKDANDLIPNKADNVDGKTEINWDTIKHVSITIISSILIIIGLVSVVMVLPGLTVSEEAMFYGTWIFNSDDYLGLESSLSDDVIIWTFNKNEILDVEIKQNSGPDVTAHYQWKIKNDKLYIDSFKISENLIYDPTEEFAGFAISSDYLNYEFSNNTNVIDFNFKDDIHIRLSRTT